VQRRSCRPEISDSARGDEVANDTYRTLFWTAYKTAGIAITHQSPEKMSSTSSEATPSSARRTQWARASTSSRIEGETFSSALDPLLRFIKGAQ
jgi:hypothetical protein